ncbi:MAG: VWA domain-containing protein [Candidatus Riflebacteria bacterium]|nr:VWA domain-containing protein [Candidatus Riflebacteria bacterium]
MKIKIISVLVLVFFCLSSCSAKQGLVSENENEDKTLAPYFKVISEDSSVEQLPLKSSSADVKIAGVISDNTVTQIYKNEGKKPIEAIYVFPGSTRAAVYGMKMTIGTRTIVAQIKKKEEARQEYEDAKKAGKSASLLEQERPNVFTMNVANILPGDEIKVEMNYTELLIPTDGVYEFIFPTVVGPRYSSKGESDAAKPEKWVANPYLQEGELPKTTFDIKISLSTGLPIQEAACSTHKVNVAFESASLAKISLDSSEKNGGNRDFILKYRLTGGKIESGLLLSKDDKENFFMLMVQPPKTVAAKNIPGREYIFIVDISGSMHGFPLDISKKLLSNLIGNLRSTDVFNVLLFAGSSQVLSESGSLPANPENIKKAITVIDEQMGGGGTEMLPALKQALALPATENFSRSVVIITDGYVSVEAEAFKYIRENLGNANMFSFGIGSSVNRFLMEGIARAGMGEALIITTPEEAPSKAEKFRKYIESPVLTKIKADFGTFKVNSVEPPSIPDVLAERPIIIFGKWEGTNQGKIKLSGVSGEGPYEQEFDVSAVKPLPENSGLRYLWARNKIAVLSDYNSLKNDPELVGEVTKLGLNYNLLTAYTSFIAVDSEVRVKSGDQAVTVNQPLPLPQGVSNLAVGGPNVSMMRKSMMAPSAPMPRQSFDSSKCKEECSDSLGGAVSNSYAPEPETLQEPKKAEVPQKSLDISIDGVVVASGINSDNIKKQIEEKLGLFDKLAKSEGKTSLSGKVTFEIKINSNGKVIEVKITSTGINDAAFEKKLAELVKRLVFSIPENKSDVEFTVIMNFSMK